MELIASDLVEQSSHYEGEIAYGRAEQGNLDAAWEVRFDSRIAGPRSLNGGFAVSLGETQKGRYASRRCSMRSTMTSRRSTAMRYRTR